MNFPKAKIPSAVQAGITEETFGHLLKHPHCVRLGRECRNKGGDGNYIPCQPLDENGEYAVEVDHIVAKAMGGTNALDNLQLLCACENRRKHARPDPRYSGNLYFDQPINVAGLRDHQRLLAYRRAVDTYRGLFEAPERLLTRFMLLAWLVGAGKTVGMASIIFGINHIRKQLNGGSAWRIKRVLWLVHQRSLVTSLADELRNDLTKYGIIERAPDVREVKHSGEWGYIADVVVACPQALWDTDNNSLTDQRRAEILSGFDAIVVDEAQFAVERYLELTSLAPRCFKFAVTATPMDRFGTLFCDIDNGAFKDWFALYSVFGYDSGFAAGFYKSLVAFDEGIGREYQAEAGGDAVIRCGDKTESETNTNIENNAARAVALVSKARNYALAASNQTNFDHHIMVRVKSIVYAQGLLEALKDHNDVCAVWSGSSGPNLGDKRHPWMLSKQNDGRIPAKGKRIVITVNIGQFGINQPYCSMIVWVDPHVSQIEIVQRIGRAIRRIKGQDDAPIRLFWNSADGQFEDALRQAINYILEMDTQRFGGFLAMTELDGSPSIVIPSPAERGLQGKHRVAIASLIGSNLLAGMSEQEATESAVSELSGRYSWSKDYADRAKHYAEQLQTEEGREQALSIPTIFEPSRFVEREEPDLSYSVARLIDCTECGMLQPGLGDKNRQTLIDKIPSDTLIQSMLTAELRKIDEESRNLKALTFYHPRLIAVGANKDKLPFRSLQQLLIDEMASAFGDYKTSIEICAKTIRSALASYYGLPSFAEEHYQAFKGPLSDAMMREDEQRRILQKAKFMILSRYSDKVPGLAMRFAPELARWNHGAQG